MIHPLAQVMTKHIGEGTKIWQYSIILEGAQIGHDCNINCHTLIESKVIIGNRVTIKPGVFIWDGVSLEDDVMIGPNATFTNDKWPKSKNTAFKLLETKVRKGVTIGANATILCGIEIGEYATIGAGAIVTRSVPVRALMVGTPAVIAGWMNTDGSKMKELENGVFIDKEGNHWRVEENQLFCL
jgi:UDP-2-acetamido-3-amino-2,3-dideoxy-glucuronate N-acetyltransferase